MPLPITLAWCAAAAASFPPMVNVFRPGIIPNESVACYLIPSLLFVPSPHPTLLAVVEAKHGSVCGDGVNSTLVMRRSTDYGATWQTPFFPHRRWAPLRKWGQPQMVYDRVTETAILLFSNETLSASPGGQQHLNTVAQIQSTDGGLTWTTATEVDRGGRAWPLGWAPTSGNGIQLTDTAARSPVGRLLFSMDTTR